MDEVAIGYNAYTISKTGSDERGVFLPPYFRSVGDYKMPVLIYLTSAFVKLIGLNELAIRLPVAIFSSLSVLVLFIFSKKYIFSSKNSYLSWWVGFLFAISPWHIYFSRFGFEATVSLFFIILNIYFLYQFNNRQTLKNLWLIFISGTIALLTYHSAKIFIPLFNLTFFIIIRSKIISFIKKELTSRSKIYYYVSLVIQVIIIFLVFKFYYFGPGSSRAKSVFLIMDYEYQHLLLPAVSQSIVASISRGVLFISLWLKRYLEYFSVNFYLYSGLNLVRPGEFGQGVIYPVELFLIFISPLILLSKKINQKIFSNPKLTPQVLLFWILIGFLPASITNNSQQSLRNLFVLPAILILITCSLWVIVINQKRIRRSIVLALISLGYFFGIIKFTDHYLVHFPYQLSEHMHYGWSQIAQYAIRHAQEYDRVIVDPRFGTEGQKIYGVPHLYFLFYSQYDPKIYQSDPRRSEDKGDFANFIFEPINWQTYDGKGNYLFIGSPWSFPKDQITPAMLNFKVKFINGQDAFWAVAGNKK